MKSIPSGNAYNDSFLETFDEYVRRVTGKYGINEVIYQRQVVNKIDFSDLSDQDQQRFEKWLNERFYTKIGILTALQRGLRIKVFLQNTNTTTVTGGGYIVRIVGW